MFLPIKADFKLPRFPWLTTVVCALCFGIFLHQVNDWNKFENAVYEFCGQSRSNIAQMIFKEISGNSPDACLDVMYGIASSKRNNPSIFLAGINSRTRCTSSAASPGAISRR